MTLPDQSEWTVVLCELGDDLRTTRCHVDPGFCVGGCNTEGHYCRCEFFRVQKVASDQERGAS